MIRLIEPQRVIDLSFTNAVTNELSLINDGIIEAAQLRWIKPVLTDDLWDELESEYPNYSALNQTLVDKLELPLAFFVKAELVPDMSINTTASGLQVLNTEFSSPATDRHRGEIQDKAIEMGRSLLKEVVRWLEKDANINNYPLYHIGKNVNNNIVRRGGIVL